MSMRCAQCGRDNEEGATFCGSCGAFLEWGKDPEPAGGNGPVQDSVQTDVMDAGAGAATEPLNPDPGAATEPAEASTAGTKHAGVAVNDVADDVRVDPGGESEAEIRVRNTGSIVDRISLQVEGPAARWATVDPPSVNIYPGEEATARLRFAPPRSADTPAGPAPFMVRAISGEDPSVTAADGGVLTVGAFQDFSMELVPHTSRGRFHAQHDVTLQSRGNTPLRVGLQAQDPDKLTTFAVQPPTVTVAPGGRATAGLRVRPIKWLWLGIPKMHPFEVTGTPETGEPAHLGGHMEQLPILPRWVPRVAILLLLALGALIAYLHFWGVVPEVARLERTAAVAKMQTAGFKSALLGQKNDTVGAGFVINSDPDVNTRLKKGSSVKVFFSAGATPITVPNVVNLDGATAVSQIQALKLVVTQAQQPSDTFPKGKVSETDPPANTVVAPGDSVKVVISSGVGGAAVAAAPVPPAPKGGGGALLPGGGGGGGGPAPAPTGIVAPPGKVALVSSLATAVSGTNPLGLCPATLTFTATVTVTGPAQVKVRFDRSDGKKSQELTRGFLGAGSANFTDTWNVTAPSPGRTGGWEQLELLSPETGASNQAAFIQVCRFPPASDYEGNGRTNLATWTPSGKAIGTWDVTSTVKSGKLAPPLQPLGVAGDVPVPGDYDGGGKTDQATWNPGSGTWTIAFASGKPKATLALAKGEVAVPGDYFGDGKTDVAIWNPNGGDWTIFHGTDTKTATTVKLAAQPGDVPVPGDYDGDGKTDVATWNPNSGIWTIIFSSAPKTPVPISLPAQKGKGEIAVPGDYDGDGQTDVATWNPTTGVWSVILSSTGVPQPVAVATLGVGKNGDIPVPIDYDGDGRTDVAIWNSSSAKWSIIPSSDFTKAQVTIPLGSAGDIPLPRLPH